MTSWVLNSYTVGLLRMLCVWLDHSSASIKAFLATPTYVLLYHSTSSHLINPHASNLPFLVEVVSKPTPPPPSPAPHIQGLSALMIGLCYQFVEYPIVFISLILHLTWSTDESGTEFNKGALYGIIMNRIGDKYPVD